MHGYHGKILVVDLTHGRVVEEKQRESIYKNLIGGRGLGAYLYLKYIPPESDPLSPENALILASGPLNGTRALLSSKIGFFFKSPITSGWGETYVGGTLPPVLSWSGYDALVILGRAKEPVYLHIQEGQVSIEKANDLWGKDVYYTEKYLKEKHGRNTVIASIGQAGENLVRFAAIMNNMWRAAGRSGGGAVFGSKKLKAIAFTVDRNYMDVAKPEEFRELMVELGRKFKNEAGPKRLREYGTSAMTIPANEMGFFPTKYWSNGSMDGWEKIGAHAVKEILVKPTPCYNCPIACGRYVKISTKWGNVELDGLEYETINTLGGQLLIDDLGAIAYMNDLADKYGLDTISLGNTLAFAVEASKMGKIKRKIDYGDAEGAIKLIEDIVFRREEGDIFAEGVARASKVLGLEDIAVHVKGLEPAAYDPRRLKGMVLGFGTSPRGACHLRMMAYYVDLRGLGGPPEVINEEKVRVLVDFEDYMSAFDSLILCKFGRGIYTWEVMVKAYNYVTGFDLKLKEFKEIAARISLLVRHVNLREGFRREHDRLPKRLLKESLKHMNTEYKLTQEEVEKYLDMYYEIRGLDSEGKIRDEIWNKLKIGDLVE